jgi:hypothetical protein
VVSDSLSGEPVEPAAQGVTLDLLAEPLRVE